MAYHTLKGVFQNVSHLCPVVWHHSHVNQTPENTKGTPYRAHLYLHDCVIWYKLVGIAFSNVQRIIAARDLFIIDQMGACLFYTFSLLTLIFLMHIGISYISSQMLEL